MRKPPHTAVEKVLVVDDVVENLHLLTTILERQGLEVLGAPSAEVALRIAKQVPVDLILLDVLLPEMTGFELCAQLNRVVSQPTPVVFVSARDDADSVAEGFSAGGVDYITKPIQEREVVARVQNQLGFARLTRELKQQNTLLSDTVRRLEEQMQRTERAEAALSVAGGQLSLVSEAEVTRWGLDGFIGTSAVISGMLQEVRRLHNFDRTNVLVTGESGSGKELIARAIHFGGPRSTQPFIAVNCSAIPRDLAESLFFGHARGAFTGATADRKGYFELAHGGTLFLDELADLPSDVQAKLLRTLEDGKISAVGSGNERTVDVRIISATNADIEQRVKGGRFRADLFFRLAQYRVQVPPLRQRRADVPLLAAHFLRVFSQEMGLPCLSISERAMARLEGYEFPGNIRELKNVVERALIVSGGDAIAAQHIQLTSDIGPDDAPETEVQPLPSPRDDDSPPSSFNLEDIKGDLIRRALHQTGNNVSAAARLLGVHRSWFYRRKA